MRVEKPRGSTSRTSGSRRRTSMATAVIIAAIALLAGAVESQNLLAENQPYLQDDFEKDPRFGIIESFESPADAADLNAGWTRITIHWAVAQEDGPDSWTPKVSDEQIQADLEVGREVVGLLIGIPEWARDEDDLPRGLWLDYDDPENLWANYVREVIERYRGRISHWIIWNEPDIRATEIAHTWDGSVADFAQLMRTAYLAAKEVDPESVIHLSAFTYWADVYGGTEQYMARLLDELLQDPQAADHNYYFDVATAHLYFQPDQVHELLVFFTDLMRERGLDQPIWLVETNAPPKDDPSWPVANWFLSVTLEEQAAFIPQAISSALAAGAERVAVYKLRDNEQDRLANPEPFGLVRLNGERRPAFETYRLAIQQLAGANHGERERWDEVGQIRLDQGEMSITVLFSRLPADQLAQVRATAGTALLIDMWGESRELYPVDGFYTVELPAASCSHSIGDYCMIGGLTYYLIQEVIAPPGATSTPTASSMLEPTASATGSAPATIFLSPEPSNTAEPTITPEIPTLPPASPTRESLVAEGVQSSGGSPTPDSTEEDGLESSSSLGLWFLGGGILLAGIIIVLVLAQRTRRVG